MRTECWLDGGGVPLHAVRWPGEGSGRPKVLLHGLGGSAEQWELVGERLAGGAGATALDLPGFGRTRAPERAAGLASAAAVLTALLEEHGPAVLVGHSMGGTLAVRVAAARPALVHRLVLVCPALPQNALTLVGELLLARNLAAALPVVGPALAALYAVLLLPEGMVEDRIRASLHDPERLDPGVRRRMVELARERMDFAEAAGAYAEAARTLLAYLADPAGMASDIPRVRAPTLVVHGAQDRLVPADLARELQRRRPDWPLELLDPCGHVPHLERPDSFVERVGGWLAAP